MTKFDIRTQQLKSSMHLFNGKIAIERAETMALKNWILGVGPASKDEDKVCLLTGTAGQGKTVVLQNLLVSLQKEGHFPVYALKADQIDFSIVNAEDFVLEYMNEFGKLSDNGAYPILIIDQIDALSKSLSSDRKPITLLDSLISNISTIANARIIVSCRPYDLDFDPLLSKYKFQKKIGMNNLSYIQVKEVLEKSNRRIHAEGSKMAMFLSTPINLELFLEYGRDNCEVISLQSLMDELWSVKITDATSKNKQIKPDNIVKCLSAIADAMDRTASLICSKKRIEGEFSAEISYLTTENILSISEDKAYVSFIHQTLADYVAARIIAESKQTMSELLEGRHQGLYVRNRVKQYFTYLREARPEVYINELKSIVTDDRKSAYRMHIKMLLLTTLAGFELPTDEEMNFVGCYILTTELFRGMFVEAVYQKGWFNFVSQHPIITKELSNGNEDTIRLIKDMCENVMLYDAETVSGYLCSQIRSGNVEWNRLWMEVAEHYPSESIIKEVKPLYLESKGEDPMKFDNYLEKLAEVDYNFVEEQILEYVCSSLTKEMGKKDEEHFILKIVYLDNPAYELLDNLRDKFPDKAAATYLKVIKKIDKLSKFDRNTDFILQNSYAYYTYSSGNYYNHHEQLVADYLTYATELAKNNPDSIREVVRECLDSSQSILYYIGLRIMRDNPIAFREEIMGVLTNKSILEEISSKVTYQIAKLLEVVFPILGNQEKSAIMDVLTTIAPNWEKIPLPDLREYQVPLYHIGRRKQELLTMIPEDYLKANRPDDWKYLQEKVRELKKADVHEPYTIYSKSGWGAHNIDKMKAMKLEDMLGAFRKYQMNMSSIDDKPTRQGECMNFQTIVTENPQKYVSYIQAILKDNTIHREYAAYGIIGLMKANYDITIIKSLTDELVKDLTALGLYKEENLYAVMDVLREMDFFINKNEVTDAMMTFMCDIVKNYPDEPTDDEELRDRIYNTGINRPRGSAAFHLVLCDGMKQYENQIFEALETCKDGSAATKGAIIFQQALLNNLNPQRNYNLYRELTKDLTPSLVSIELNNSHPLVFFINTRFDDLKDFFLKLYDVEASHEMLSQLLWIAWVRGINGAEKMLHDLLDKSEKAKVSLVRFFSKDLANQYPNFVENAAVWMINSENEKVGKAFDFLINDLEDQPWEDIVSYVDAYSQGNVFKYASHQFLDFMQEQASLHPEEVLRWVCEFAKIKHESEYNMYHSSTIMSILVAAYNAIRKYDKSNEGLEKALNTMDELMAIKSVRRGMRHFLFELDNR